MTNCPRCGTDDIIPIRYGFPSREMFERAYAGEVVLGGCVIWLDAPTSHCRRCGNDFGRLGDRAPTQEGDGD